MSAFALAVLVGSISLSSATAQDWEEIWRELARVKGGESFTEEMRQRLDGHARTEDPRGQLLRAELELLSGRDAGAIGRRLFALEPRPFAGLELWFLADVLPNGPERAEIVLAALGGAGELEHWQVLLAWNTSVEEARALRLAGTAVAIQEELDRRCAADWSAIDLALTLRLLGKPAQADGVLAGAIERAGAAGQPTADLWSQRGIVALGAGDESAGRDYLGRALALGSEDAGLVLARLDLVAGRPVAARRGFRPSILRTPQADWALRGWGMALLPAADAPPKRLPPSSPEDH